MQQLLVAKGLGRPREGIRRMLDDPGYDRRALLVEQRKQLSWQARRAEAMVRAVDAALASLDEEEEMEAEKLFEGFEPAEHEDKVRERWGSTNAYAEAGRRTKSYTKAQWKEIKAENDSVLARLAERLSERAAAGAAEVMDLAEEHRLHIDRWYYPCDPGMHAGLGEMYVADERFAAHFEKRGSGLAAYSAEAIQANAARR